jgi:hypothetical protein
MVVLQPRRRYQAEIAPSSFLGGSSEAGVISRSEEVALIVLRMVVGRSVLRYK